MDNKILEIVKLHLIQVDEIKNFKMSLECMFDCFIHSKVADDKDVRTETFFHYLELKELLTQLENLNL